MDTVLAVLLLAAGAVLLTVGAEAFAGNVAAAAARLGLSTLALGVLLAGAEPEEAVTAVLAAGQGHPALAAGDAIGANLVVVTLALGLAGCFAPLPVGRRVQEYAVAAAVLGALAWLLAANGVLGRFEGLVLVVVFAVAAGWVWRRERRPPAVGELAEHPDVRLVVSDAQTRRTLLRLLLGALGLVAGGALAVRGAGLLVGVLDLRESVVGLTVLGLVTSAETIALVWSGRRHRVEEVAVAGAVGALAYNAGVTLGLAALVSPLPLGRHNVILTVAALTAVLPLVLLTARRRGVLPRPVAGALVLCYVAVTGWLLAR